ncbi:MAG: VOC family protein [Lachnospiraceae bacterium]|nr:VOC family protein [Lachnospiraceae bacterium]
MYTYGSIYLIAKDFDKSILFYRALFERDVIDQNKNRFAVFDINGLTLSIMNGTFDREHSDEVDTKGEYCALYDDYAPIMEAPNCGKVVINLSIDDLRAEYERVKSLDIAANLTKIRYINARNPYYYFCLKDPDGNTIEITGNYEGEV